MASIRKRGKSWECRVRREGKTVCRSFSSKAEAQSFAGQMESKLIRGVYVSQKEAERTTVHEALERFIHDYVYKHLAHPRKEELKIKRLQKRDFARLPLAKVRGVDISNFIREREDDGVSPNTIRLELATVSRLFEVARKDWGMEGLVNPVKNVTSPKLPKGRDRRLEHGEEERLLEAASEKFRPLVSFAIETALRREEIAKLKWRAINLRARTLTLTETKNGETRSVPLSPRALEILHSIPRNISGSVFGYQALSITSAMRDACSKAGLQDLRFHDLRHEAISRLFEDTDLDAMEIASISGHKTLQMLKRYSHLRASRLADRLAGAKRGG